MFALGAPCLARANAAPSTRASRSSRCRDNNNNASRGCVPPSSTIVARASPEDAPAPVALSRRDTLAAASVAFASAVLAARPAPALAAYGASASGSAEETADGPVTFSTFYGAAAPPATYGTLGGTTKDKAKYSYEIPSNWTEEAPSKVEKGAGGQDSRFVLVGSRGATRCSVLTLNRSGEDGAAFDLTDKALAAIAGADSRLQEAITTGEVKSKRSSENGQDYVTFSVTKSTTPGEYAVKITVDNTGRLFAYVLTAPERTFEQERKTFARMLDSFRTYDSVSQFV